MFFSEKYSEILRTFNLDTFRTIYKQYITQNFYSALFKGWSVEGRIFQASALTLVHVNLREAVIKMQGRRFPSI